MRWARILGAAAAGVLTLPAAAHATVELGSLDPSAVNPGTSNCTATPGVAAFQATTAESPNPYVVPAGGGVITSFSTKYGAAGGTPFEFFVMRPNGPVVTPTNTPQSYTAVVELTVGAPDNFNGVSTYSTGQLGIRVQAGDVIGISGHIDGVESCYAASVENAVAVCGPPEPATGQSTDCDATGGSSRRVNVAATLEQSTDLSISQMANPPTVPVGGVTSLSVTAGNAGPVASDATVVETLPAGLEPVSARTAEGTCSTAGQVITCQLQTTPVGGGALLDLLVKGVVAGSQVVTGQISGPFADPNSANNTASTTLVVQGADFTISSKSVSKKGVITLNFDAPQAGNFVARATTTLPSGQHREHKSLLYGTSIATASAAGPVSLRIKPKKPAQKALAAGKKLRVSVTVTFGTLNGTQATQTTKVTVKPPRK